MSKFDGGMKPDGTWENDMDAYLASWGTILAPLREMGFRIIAFDPRITFALGNDSAQVSVAIAEKIGAAWYRRPREERLVKLLREAQEHVEALQVLHPKNGDSRRALLRAIDAELGERP